MAKFDTTAFVTSVKEGDNPIDSIGGAFGVPSCITDLGMQLLELIPGNILGAMNAAAQDGIDKANDLVKNIKRNILYLFGIDVVTNEDGEDVYICRWFKYGSDPVTFASQLASFVGAATAFAGQLYSNIQDIGTEIERIRECLNQLGVNVGLQKDSQDIIREALEDNYDTYVSGALARDLDMLGEAEAVISSLTNFINDIQTVLSNRINDPDNYPEPEYNENVFLQFSSLAVPVPLRKKKRSEEIIRLAYGPPVAISGKFVLCIDGLYYDSQSSGTVSVISEIQNKLDNLDNQLKWKLEQDPNLGGRGKQITIEDAKYYFNTIFDENLIDESDDIKTYYEQDEVLQSLIGNKNRRLFDVSGEIEAVLHEGGSQAIVSNLKQVLISESSHHQLKINKRKKQIELAVRLSQRYGKPPYAPGSIPVNDFSYLEGVNYKLEIDSQKRLILDQADVSGVVLPLQTVLVEPIRTSEDVMIEHLIINNIGLGAIISNPSGERASVLTINKNVESDQLVALYNLLKFEVVNPSSTDYKLKNSSILGQDYDAQIVGTSRNKIFSKGVGIAYLEGVTKHSKTNPTVPSSVGSYIRLPAEARLQDLFFSDQGATFEAWVHVPELDGESYGFNDDYDVSGLYRLILANENTGIKSTATKQANILEMTRNNSTDFSRGLIFGFTRDRRLTSDLPPSNNSNDNPVENACLVLAPTQSYDSSSVGFLNKSFAIDQKCTNLSSIWYNMRFPIFEAVNGVSLSSCGKEFCMLTMTFDPQKDLISMYCDGQLLTASSYGDVFGIDPRKDTVNVPSLTQSNSFSYNASSMSAVSVAQLRKGPGLDSVSPLSDNFFTPWIIGGGYTDGMQTGNFMGGEYGGLISGLRGFIGSIKFYSKPLTSDQVLNNYDASRLFFKNIDVPNLMWEPIISE